MKFIELKNKIRFLNDSLLINNEILIISDIHIGYEEYLYKESLFMRVQLKEILEKLDSIFKNLEKEGIKIKKIIILGDLKHEFGIISDSEWRETIKFLDYLIEKIDKNGEIILIKGNHDTILGPIARKKEIKIVENYQIDEIAFIHGDKILDNCKKTKVLIMGHLHPAIRLNDEYKSEKFKCFLIGKQRKKKIYILPSFSPLSFGYELNNIKTEKPDYFSIIKVKDLMGFEVIIYNTKDNKEYDFGKLKNII